ncbi:hypothetical protein F5887DRAFT_957897, partial [Amanita rubescens]
MSSISARGARMSIASNLLLQALAHVINATSSTSVFLLATSLIPVYTIYRRGICFVTYLKAFLQSTINLCYQCFLFQCFTPVFV